MDNASTLIDDLLDHWESERAVGRVLTPEELCKDHPKLIQAARQQIEALCKADELLTHRDRCHAKGS